MKTKILAVMAIFGMVASASAVKINDNLSINGFIDGSYSSVETDGVADTQDLGIDEVEINFNVNVGNVSGLVALDNGADDDSTFDIEQAHFTYNINDAVSVTFGRYGSALGFEREDPAGLYTVSRAYGSVLGGGAEDFNFGDIDNVGTSDGLLIAYAGSNFSIALSLQNATGNEADLESDDLNAEIALSYTGLENTVIGLGFFLENNENQENDFLNAHISRQFGKLLIGAEYSEIDSSGLVDESRDAYLVLADYDVSDKLGVALRLSSAENQGANSGDVDRFTIAPNYAITESLGAIIEYSDVDDAGTNSEEFAVELTYTF